MTELLTVSQASRQLGVSEGSVRAYEKAGLLSALRVGNGMRLFRQGDVERLRTERQKKSEQQNVRD